MLRLVRPLLFSLSLTLVVLSLLSPAQADIPAAQTAWRLLDYIAVDYREAVANGKVVNPGEYAEMTEFARSAQERIEGLPAASAKADLLRDATALQASIAKKADPDVIASDARALASDLIKAYPVPLAPTEPPDFELGHTLYEKQCATCHGVAGDGKGPAAPALDPPPIAFADKTRAQERSVFGLYQVIEQGLDGTSMPSFASLPAQDRWALAFYVGSFSYPETDAAEGEKLWKEDTEFRAKLNMEKLVGLTPASLSQEIGDDRQGDVLTAYLRRNPTAVVEKPSGSLALARARLQEASAAYAKGDRKTAGDLALSAYLDGFEPVEAILVSRDNALMVRIEGAMGALRAAISNGDPVATVRAQAEAVDALFVEAEAILAPSAASAGSSFFGALTILLREGLEALLIVVAMVSFLRKANREDVLPYVHGGWVAALIAGFLTWGLATWFITISGATRELTEGFGSILAALILLWVGVWLHGKSNVTVWQRYIREKLNHALTRRSAWFLFGLSFIVVYREVFETVLFCAAIWNQGNGGEVLAGAGVAIVALMVIAWAMMRYSKTLPIRQFFAYSSALIAVLAVVLTGKGVSALQEAAYLPIHPLAGFPRFDLLGLYPTIEGAAAQVAMLVLLAIGFGYNGRSAPK